jgi:hypothetical protein
MVHDRRVDGAAAVFGNQGGLFMNAMTWWDHETGSVWSQVWGQAIAGPLKGATLDLIPASIVPWGTWKAEHPDTLAMTNDKGGIFNRTERPRDGWVIGIALAEHSKAFYYPALAQDGVVNDFIGPFPVVLYTNPETRNVKAYLRQVGDDVLTFKLDDSGQFLVDDETGTSWDIAWGTGREGKLQGQVLLRVPYLSSFDWAWLDFHPNSEFYPANQ